MPAYCIALSAAMMATTMMMATRRGDDDVEYTVWQTISSRLSTSAHHTLLETLLVLNRTS